MWRSEKYAEKIQSTWAVDVGRMIHEDRENARLTLRGLAREMQISPTHLARLERGDRPLESAWDVVNICRACRVPIDKYLSQFGYESAKNPVREAFPALETAEQEKAVREFARLFVNYKLTPEDITQILNTATAYAAFCDQKARSRDAAAALAEAKKLVGVGDAER